MPLKFLLNDHIDLAKDTTVKRVDVDDKSAMIEIEDKATFGGKSDITLVFDPDPFALKQWTVLDPQGFQTVATLFDIHLVSKPDPSLFHIDDFCADRREPPPLNGSLEPRAPSLRRRPPRL